MARDTYLGQTPHGGVGGRHGGGSLALLSRAGVALPVGGARARTFSRWLEEKCAAGQVSQYGGSQERGMYARAVRTGSDVVDVQARAAEGTKRARPRWSR